jgi:hypothetical protein
VDARAGDCRTGCAGDRPFHGRDDGWRDRDHPAHELIAQVGQQAKTVKQLADSHVVIYKQLLEQIQSGVKISGLSIADAMKMRTDMDAYQTSLQALGLDLNGYSRTIDARITEARLQNLTLQDYVSRENRLVQN